MGSYGKLMVWKRTDIMCDKVTGEEKARDARVAGEKIRRCLVKAPFRSRASPCRILSRPIFLLATEL